jgi:hypothetical protein
MMLLWSAIGLLFANTIADLTCSYRDARRGPPRARTEAAEPLPLWHRLRRADPAHGSSDARLRRTIKRFQRRCRHSATATTMMAFVSDGLVRTRIRER